jgi:hypothetical protein
MVTAAGKQYLSITNWDKYQCNDRKGRNIRLYVKDYCDKDGGDIKYSRLTALQRYVFDAICRLRGRLGRNPENDPTWIARATQMLPRERTHIAQAIHRLCTDGFLSLTNQQLNLSDSDSDTDSDKSNLGADRAVPSCVWDDPDPFWHSDEAERLDPHGCIREQLWEEEQIVHAIPPSLTQWTANLRPLLPRVPLSETDAAKAFHGMSELLVNGAAKLFGTARGSTSTLLDYADIYAVDEVYGSGTSEALASEIRNRGVGDDNTSFPISERVFVWGHLAGQLLTTAIQ